jgi:hypothetical protein
MAFFRAVAQPQHPVAAAAEVVATFLDCLGGDRSDGLVPGSAECLEKGHLEGIDQVLASHGVGEVADGKFEDQQVTEFAAVAEKRQLVLAAALALELTRNFYKFLYTFYKMIDDFSIFLTLN